MCVTKNYYCVQIACTIYDFVCPSYNFEIYEHLVNSILLQILIYKTRSNVGNGMLPLLYKIITILLRET